MILGVPYFDTYPNQSPEFGKQWVIPNRASQRMGVFDFVICFP